MNPIAIASAFLIATPLLAGAAAPPSDVAAEQQQTAVDLTGRWKLNADLSDKPVQPGEPGDPAGPSSGRRPPSGGMPGGGGGGRSPRGGGGAGMRGGPGGSRQAPTDMAKMRDAIRVVLHAPAELIVTRNDDELVFTAMDSGEIIRVLVTGKKLKTMAGGAEHDVKASYKDNALLVESSFGPLKVVDTWRVSPDRRQLERVTKTSGGPQGGRDRQIRRVYERGTVTN
ncbi:MAG TPA: hypothetical protein VK886_12160 [Vicinamibacterales bacterium]|nr:hypothetical protein [Vicinamibacterales bacterium]